MKTISILAAFLSVAAVSAQAETVVVTKGDCAKLIEHKARADVEYKPGEGVRGKKVAPADLPGSRAEIALPETVTIDIEMDLAKKYGLPDATGKNYTGTIKAGTVSVDTKTGKALYNGKPLTTAEQDSLAKACQRRGGK